MKKNLLLITILFASFNLFGQLDLKINPIGLLFDSPDLVAEYGLSSDFGVELGIGLNYGDRSIVGIDFARSGYNILMAGKYYFGPNNGFDNFFAGVYVKQRAFTLTDKDDSDNFDYGYKSSRFALGLLTGYKWLSNRGVMLEIATGLGRSLRKKTVLNRADNDIAIPNFGFDFVWRVAVGYRIGGGDN